MPKPIQASVYTFCDIIAGGFVYVAISLPDHLYLFEFKLDGSAQAALEQIEADGYSQKLRLDARPTTLIGVNPSTGSGHRFDSHSRKVQEWLSQPALYEIDPGA